MHIITRQEIETMFETLQPKLDESNLIVIEDDALSKVLKYYLFLKQFTQDITDNFSYTYEDILYSQYYWFVSFKNHYFSKIGYDGGMDQQAFHLLEHIFYELDGDVDWTLLEDIENQLKEKDENNA